MFFGIFSSFIPYFVAAGFSVLYLLAAVFHPVINDCLACRAEDEQNKKHLFTKHQDKSDYHQYGNYYLETQTKKKSGYNNYTSFLQESNQLEIHADLWQLADKSRIIVSHNSADIFSELFYRPPPVG